MPNAAIRLRPFTLADARMVASWLDGPGLGVPAGPIGSRWAERLLTDPGVHAWIAVRGTESAGFARFDVGPDRIAELTIAVAGHLRRSGIGSAMLRLLQGQAQKLRILRIQAVVDPANAAALAFFGQNGFDEVPGSTPARIFVRWMHEVDPEVLEIEG